MTPDQMRAKSQEKFDQIQNLLSLLQVTIEPRDKIDSEGFIQKVLYFNDHEKYPLAPVQTIYPGEGQAAQEPKAEAESTQQTEAEGIDTEDVETTQ